MSGWKPGLLPKSGAADVVFYLLAAPLYRLVKNPRKQGTLTRKEPLTIYEQKRSGYRRID
jgi:hypothetical protein